MSLYNLASLILLVPALVSLLVPALVSLCHAQRPTVIADFNGTDALLATGLLQETGGNLHGAAGTTRCTHLRNFRSPGRTDWSKAPMGFSMAPSAMAENIAPTSSN